jgi:spore coat protein U-like protein
MLTKKLGLLAVAVASISFGGAALADNTIAVSASIAEACVVSGGTAMSFGPLTMLDTVGPTTTPSVQAAAFDATCTNGTAAPKFTYVSSNTSGSDYRLIGATVATDFLAYTLYPSTDASGTAIAANTATAHPAFSPNGVKQTLDVSGKIVSSEKAAKHVQSYSDTITVTVSWGA